MLPEPLRVDVKRAWMLKAVRWACRRLRYTIDRSGMNPRRLSEKLDDGIMGETASIAVMQFLTENGRHVAAYDELRRDNYRRPDPGWDVVVSKGNAVQQWATDPPDPTAPPPAGHRLSVKSSRLPAADNDDIYQAIRRRDFKLFKQSADIAADITADYEVQVYYERARSRLANGHRTSRQKIAREHAEAIMRDLELARRYGTCYVTGFCPRECIIAHSKRLATQGKKRTWPSWHEGHRKEMWKAPLRLGTSPHDLTG